MASEGWGALRGQPPHWEAPEELRVPTASVAINLAVQMMGSNMIGNDVIEAIASFVSAKVQIELWMGRHDPPLPLQRQFVVGRVTAEAVRGVYESWVEYEKVFRLTGGKASKIVREKEELIRAVRKATDILVHAKSDEPE
ncbi:hypothetical protein ABZ642_01565 [Streptomyces sp. NPDC007157]|uniref:hypothetical protein n=1 Tax=Streptomyces sp. NPDC007157 TaxID=3154681 RepID=UPI0033EF9778